MIPRFLMSVCIVAGVVSAVLAQPAEPSGAAVPPAAASEPTKTIDERINEMRLELHTQTNQFGPNHREVGRLRSELTELEGIRARMNIEMQRQRFPAERVVSVDFKGGTVAEYIDAVQAAAEAKCVIALLGPDPIPFPATRLSDVRLGHAITALDAYRVNVNGRTLELDVLTGGDVITVRVFPGNTEKQVSNVWSIRSIVETGTTKPEDILSAIQAALALQSETVAVSYHEGTSLVMCRGTPEQVSIVNSVINTIASDAGASSLNEYSKKLNSELAAMRSAMMELRSAREADEKRMADLTRQIDQIKAVITRQPGP